MVLVSVSGLDPNFAAARSFASPAGAAVVSPHRLDSSWYHPDLVAASDVVIGKVGYSTLAETYHAGVPFGFIPHAGFRESPALEAFIGRHMAGLRLAESDMKTGRWVNRLDALIALPRHHPGLANGADRAAAFILGRAADAPPT